MKDYKIGDEIKLNKNEEKILSDCFESAGLLRLEAYKALVRANKESSDIWSAFFKKYPNLKNYNLQFDKETKKLLIINNKELIIK